MARKAGGVGQHQDVAGQGHGRGLDPEVVLDIGQGKIKREKEIEAMIERKKRAKRNTKKRKRTMRERKRKTAK